MELKDLIGLHELSGVDMETKQIENYNNDDAQVIRFVLDGKTYIATEDPNDGYRSTCNDLEVSDEPVKNTFSAHKVMGTMMRDDDHKNDIIQCNLSCD